MAKTWYGYSEEVYILFNLDKQSFVEGYKGGVRAYNNLATAKRYARDTELILKITDLPTTSEKPKFSIGVVDVE